MASKKEVCEKHKVCVRLVGRRKIGVVPFFAEFF